MFRQKPTSIFSPRITNLKSPLKTDRKGGMKLLPGALIQPIAQKQIRDLYMYMSTTIHNYLGMPSDACSADVPEILRYANQICEELDAKDKKAIASRAESLPPPDFQVFVEIIEAELFDVEVKNDKAAVFCRLGTCHSNRQSTTSFPLCQQPHWKEQFTLEVRETKGGVLFVEVWIRFEKHETVLVGEAKQHLETIPCTGDELWLSLQERTDLGLNRGFIKLRCCFGVAPSHERLQSILRQILLCRLFMEHELSLREELHLDIVSAGQTLPVCEQTVLYQHGLIRVLSAPAVTLLHQHALQNGLTPWENNICCWLVVDQLYRKENKINIAVVHALLHEISILGAGPQRRLEPELKATLLQRLDLSSMNCCSWLWNLHSKMQQGPTKCKELQHMVRYLSHLDKYYINETIEKAEDAMQQGCEQWIMKILSSSDQDQDWETVSEGIVSSLNSILKDLQVIDPILWSEWKLKYSAIVSRHLDKAVKASIGPLMARMSEQLAAGRTKQIVGEKVDHLVLIFLAVKNLGQYTVDQLPPVSSREMLALETCHQWVGSHAFQLYLWQRVEESLSWLVSWLEREEVEAASTMEKDPCCKLTKQLLRLWRELIWPESRPPTVALVQVIYKFSTFCSHRMRNYITDQSLFCTKTPFTITAELCTALNKMEKLLVYVGMVKDDVMSRVAAGTKSDIWDPLDTASSEIGNVIISIHDEMISKIREVIEPWVTKVTTTDEEESSELLLELKSYCSRCSAVFTKYMTEKAGNEMKLKISSMATEILEEFSTSLRSSRYQKLSFIFQKSFSVKSIAQKMGDN